jgi:CheY-like chemotaxis protein
LVADCARAVDSSCEETFMNPQQSRLLVVDDNEMNRDMLARRLARSGYLVDVAESARHLAQRVKENALDLVLLDIEMPQITGFDALKALRNDYSPTQLPIIMVTARNQREDIIKALTLGANDYLTKPVDFSVALARIETLLSQKRAQGSGKPTTEFAVRNRGYTPRYPFAADADIVDLKSGTRVRGVSSDLSLVGCFVCTQGALEIGTAVRLTLKHKNQNALMLAVVRVLKPKIGMGLQVLEVDSISSETLLRWLDDLRESR